MRKEFINGGLVVLIVFIGAAVTFLFTPRLGPEGGSTEPRIIFLPPEKVLVVEAKGDPALVSPKAIGLLYKGLRSVKGAPWMVAPRARWAFPSPHAPKSEWTAKFALPVPQATTSVPEKASDGLKTSLETWSYGDVVEVLHVGPYADEKASEEIAKAYAKKAGYEVLPDPGNFEEVYLKGPGMFWAGNPLRYRTLLRFKVKKANPARL